MRRKLNRQITWLSHGNDFFNIKKICFQLEYFKFNHVLETELLLVLSLLDYFVPHLDFGHCYQEWLSFQIMNCSLFVPCSYRFLPRFQAEDKVRLNNEWLSFQLEKF